MRARVLPPATDHPGLTGIEMSGQGLEPVTLWIDSAGQVARESFQPPAPPGQAAGGQPVVEETFSDYRSVGGLQVPFRAVRRIAETTVAERDFTDFKYNVPIDPALFKRPE